MGIKKGFCWCLILWMGLSEMAIAQERGVPNDAKNIVHILQKVEQTSNWVFNYDVQQLSEYSFAGQLKKGDIKTQLTHLFYKTPYTFDIQDQSILIFQETPKTYRFCGQIKDSESQSNLPFANIFTNDQKHGTQTDMEGKFDFSFTAFKHQMVSISYIGYQTQSFMVQEWNQANCPSIFLEIDGALFGEEIIIKDYILSEITEGEGFGGVHIDYQKLSKRQTIIEQDILKTVQLIPGVNSIDESATNLQIRGGTPDQNLILWEDVTLYDPGHLFGMLSAINPYVIEEVAVYKGAYDPRYDNRVGGIVDLSLSDEITNKLHGGLGSTLTEAHAYFKIPIVKNKLSLLLSGRNSIQGLYHSPTLQNYSTKVFQGSKVEDQKEEVEEGDLSANQLLDFYDLNGKLVFQPTDRWTIKASWLKTQNTFNYETELFEDELTTIDNVLVDSEAFSLSASFQLKKNWQMQLAYSNSTYSNDYLSQFIETAEDEITYSNNVYNDIKDEGLILQSTYQFSPYLSFEAGYDYNQKRVNFNVDISALYEGNIEDINFSEGHFHNVFAALAYRKEKLQVNGGMRSTYFVEAGQIAYAPRLNIQYALSDKVKLKASSGIFQQYISQLKEFGENDLDLNTQVWILNAFENEEDPLQSAKKIAGGFIYQEKGWLIDLEGYYHKTAGLSTLGPSFGTSSATSEIDDFLIGSSTAQGIDFLIKKRWRNYQSWLNYSFSNIDFNFPIFNTFTATNEQPHNLNWTNNYDYKKWNFTLSYQFKSGLPYTQGLGVEKGFDEDEFMETGDLEESSFYFVEYDNPNETRLPDYHRLDAGISYRPTFKNSNIKAELTFSIINLLNRTNTFRRDFFLEDFDDETEEDLDEPTLFGVDKRLLKRTPLISVRMYW